MEITKRPDSANQLKIAQSNYFDEDTDPPPMS